MIQVQIDNKGNDSFYFPAIQKRIRGTLDLRRTRDADAAVLSSRWEVVPGAIVEFDGKSGAIVDPLYEPRYSALRQQIEDEGKRLPPEREEFPNIDAATWAFWLQAAIDVGLARVVKGTMPTVTGKPRKQFVSLPVEDPRDKIAKMQLAAQLAVMTPQQRKDYDKILADMGDA